MTWIKAYLACLVIFLALDALWLGVLARDSYARHIGHLMAEKVNWTAAVVFYAIYLCGILFFAVRPALDDPGRALQIAALHGALFGLMTYATYGLTNLATLRAWPASMVWVDTGWGVFITGTTATAATWFASLGRAG